MSHSIDLPDEVYAAVQKEAEATGTSPAEVIAAKFVKNEEPVQPKPKASSKTLRQRLAHVIGAIDSGRSDGSENVKQIFIDHLKKKHGEGRL